MLTLYKIESGTLAPHAGGLDPIDDFIWIDLNTPSREEELQVESALGIDVPTREEMQEIELSSRLYSEDGATFMTANILSHTDADDVVLSPMTFILHQKRLITVRYTSPRSVTGFVARCSKGGNWSSDLLAIGLIEANIERCADVIERASAELDGLSRSIFLPPEAVTEKPGTNTAKKRKRAKTKSKPRDFQRVLDEIGLKGDLVSKIRDSLVSIQRLLTHYIGQVSSSRSDNAEIASRLKSVSRDVEALREHASFMTQKVNFLLDATLGMINIEQNAIIKIFSVAAVIFLPPTLIASIYGMNFEFMPELNWTFGYPLAIGLMVLSAILPYAFFKRRGWL
ncbi:MAG: magnesium transporter [Hyphomonas sp. 34-62-18]|nr:magnesium transporter CorA family protein [Hyphomonas sp. 34-62-18]OZB17786.1 MAG: magnesium transporter [Hyphomonas sp. 34-62-18]